MSYVAAIAGATIFACGILAHAEPHVPCLQSLNAPLQSRAILTIESRPAGLEIVAGDEDALHVTCTAGNNDSAHVEFHFAPSPLGGKLTIRGTNMHHGDNNLQIRIQVPRRTNLRVRMFAGELKIEEVKGDKDLDIGAGQISIKAMHPAEYRSVNASVGVGQVNAPAFNADKGGFFRHVHKDNASGEYRLRVHVSTGEIDLLGNPEPRNQPALD